MFANWTWIWKAVFLLIAGLWFAAATGCTITTKNNGAMWIKFSQGVEIGHTAAKTSDEDATAGIDGKALVEHVIDLKALDDGQED